MKTRTRHVVCWVEAHFNLIDLATVCQVLSVAGSNWNWRPYRISLASRHGGLVPSRAQVNVDTVSLIDCAPPDVVILAGGEPHEPWHPDEEPFVTWQQLQPLWVALRDGVHALVRLEPLCQRLAVARAQQERVREFSPHVHFENKDYHLEGRVLSCATLDVLPAALLLLERQVGQSARRFVETQLGLTHAGIQFQGLDKLSS